MATIRPDRVRSSRIAGGADTPVCNSRRPTGLALLGVVALLGLVALMPGTGWVGPPATGVKGDKVAAGKPAPTKLDVVFVLDTTGSMEPVLTNLSKNIGGFTKTLAESKVDFQIG